MAKKPRKRMDDPGNWGRNGRRRSPDDGDAGLGPPPTYDAGARAHGSPADAPADPPADDTFEGWLEQVPRSFAVPSRERDESPREAPPAESAPTSWREEVPEGFAVPPATVGLVQSSAGADGDPVTDWDGDFDWTPPRVPRRGESPAEETAPGAWKDFTAGTSAAAGQPERRDAQASTSGSGAWPEEWTGPQASLSPDERSSTRMSGGRYTADADASQRPYTGDEPPSGAAGQWRRIGGPVADDRAADDVTTRRAAATGTAGGGPAGPGGPRRTYRLRGRDGDGPDGRRLAPAGKVLIALIIGLGLAALLNAQSLQSQAEALHVGTARSIALALVKPITAISSTLRLDEPRAAIEGAMGRGAQEVAGVHTRVVDGDSGSSGSGSSGSGSSGSGSSGSGSGGKASPSPGAAVFTPTKDKKLALWVGGDSMAMTFGESLVAMADRTGVIDTALDYHVSSGLSRPDFFNWPKRLTAEMRGFQPDVVVFASGANDGQDVQHEGKLYYYGTKEWNDLYRERVAVAMNIAGGEQGRPVWWVGMPIARDPAQSEIYRNINKIYKEEAKKRPNVHYVDTYTMFADANGDYSDYLTGISGKKELMRQGDGIHWSRAGSDLVAAEVMEQIAELYKFKFTP